MNSATSLPGSASLYLVALRVRSTRSLEETEVGWGEDLPLLYSGDTEGACRRSFLDLLSRFGSYCWQGWNDLNVVVQQRGIDTGQVVPDQITLLGLLSITLLLHFKLFEQIEGPTTPQTSWLITNNSATIARDQELTASSPEYPGTSLPQHRNNHGNLRSPR